MRVTYEYGSMSRDQEVKVQHGHIIRGVGLGGRVVVVFVDWLECGFALNR